MALTCRLPTCSKKNKSTIGSKSTSADPSSVESPVTSVTSSPLPVSLTPSSLTRVGTAGSSLLSDKLDKKKKKQIDDSMDLEKALRELEISASAEGGKRRACQCQGKKSSSVLSVSVDLTLKP